MSIEDKIKVIDEIIKKHPSYGVDLGWSYYTGGMADTGDWYFRKMLDEPIEKLQSFLSGIIEQENRPRKEPTKSQKELWIEFHNEIEARLLLGEHFKKQ